MHEVAVNGNKEDLENSQNVDINVQDDSGATALLLAVSFGKLENAKVIFLDISLIFQWLLEHKANPNLADLEGKTPLHHAVECGEENCVKILLEFGADPLILDNQKISPLTLWLFTFDF